MPPALTLDQLKERFPKASESFLRLNSATLSHAAAQWAPPPKKRPKCSQTAGKQPSRAPRASKVARTRNGGTITEAAFWGTVRSGLRRTFRWWKPALEALKAARVAVKGPRGQKWAYLCADCGKLFLRKQVQIDHKVPCGALTDYAHVGEFLRRLTPEQPEAYACRCLACHQIKTNAEKANKGKTT